MLDGRKSRFPDFLAPSIAGGTAENDRKSHPGHHPHCYARVTGGGPGSPAVARLCDPFGAQAVWVGTQLACTLILLGPLPDHRRVALGASGSRATLTKFGLFFTPSPHYVSAASLAGITRELRARKSHGIHPKANGQSRARCARGREPRRGGGSPPPGGSGAGPARLPKPPRAEGSGRLRKPGPKGAPAPQGRRPKAEGR